MKAALLLAGLVVLSGCGGTSAQSGKQQAAAPAKVRSEGDLTTITLTPEAEQRLGIQTVEVAYQASEQTRTVAGEVIIPPGQALTVAAPLAGTLAVAEEGLPPAGARVGNGRPLFRLAPLLPVERNLRVSTEAEVAAAATRLEAAKARAARADQLLRDDVGTVRAQEAAGEEVKLAETALKAAQAKLDQINRAPLEADVTVPINAPQDGILWRWHAAAGQKVAAGAPLFEVAKLDPIWIRAPVYAGDLALLETGAAARVRLLHAAVSATARLAHPVQAPPSADPLAATADLFFRLANPDLSLRPGQKVSVTIPWRGRQQALQVPRSAILRDIHGGAWVYENPAAQVFVRRRVDIDHVAGETAVLRRGPKPGARVVTAGAAELFGAEFGPGK